MQGGELATAPVVVCATGNGLVIGTDAGEWRSVAGDQLRALPATGAMSAVGVDAAGLLHVACWEPSVKQLRDGAWTEVALGAVPLALTSIGRVARRPDANPDGLARAGMTDDAGSLVAGDSGGGLAIVPTTARIPVQELTAPDAIVELHALGDALVVLGARGAVGVTAWPRVPDAPLVSIDTAAIGRVYAGFAGMRDGTLILAGRRGLGILERDRVTAVTELHDPIRTVAAFRDHGRACVVTDAGDAWLVDATLARVGRLQLGDPLAGVVPAPDGSVLAWTLAGAMYVVNREGKTTRIAEGDVVLGAPDPSDPHGYLAVHWTQAGGARVTRGRAPWI